MRPLPVLLLAGLLLSACTSQHKPAPQAVAVATATAVGLPVAATPTGLPGVPTAEVGKQLFTKYCSLCHGVNAQGYAADNAPSLVSKTFQATATDEFLRAAIVRGRPGTAMAGYGKAVGGPLELDEIEAILAFVRAKPAPRVERVELPLGPAQGDVARGRGIYVTYCAGCHGTATQRVDSVHLANPVLLETASDAFLRYAILHGRPGTRMEAWGPMEILGGEIPGKLQAQQIEDVLVYVRSMAQQMPPLVVPPPLPPALPRTAPIVLNPRGKTPEFHLRDERFASLDEVKAALDKKQRIVIADARAPSDWLNLRITGSISTPYYDLKSLDDIPNDGTWVIAYCACPHHASGEVVDQLRKRGYKHTAVLDEGVFAWQHKGYPIEQVAGTLPTPAPPALVLPALPVLPGVAVPPPAPAPARAPAPAPAPVPAPVPAMAPTKG